MTKEPDQPDAVVMRFSPGEIDAATLLAHVMRELENAPIVVVEINGVRLRISQDG